MTNVLSYEFQNTVRSVNEVFRTIIENNPVTSRLLTFDNRPFDNTKLERLDDYDAQLTRTVTSAYTAGDGTILTTNTEGLKLGSIVKFELPTGATSTLIAKVTAITPNTDFDIVVYGGTVDQNLGIGTKVILLDVPVQEGSDAGTGEGQEPVMKYNYSQIMDEIAQVSMTAFNQKMYGFGTTSGQAMDYEVARKLQQIAYKVGGTSISMPRVQRSGSENGTMGGWLWFLQQETGNATNGGAAAISAAKLNEAFEKMYQYNANGLTPTIVANPVQAKRLSGLNTTNTRIMRDDTTAGSYVENFVSDFGDVASIVYSPQMDKDKIAIIDPTAIRLRPFLNDELRDVDATLPGSRMIKRRIMGQYSLEVKNAKVMQYIYNLSV